MKEVNLGCGTNVASDWINIDISYNIILSKFPLLKYVLFKARLINKTVYEQNWPSGIFRHDVTKGLPFETNSIDYIYTSHLLEHSKKDDAQKYVNGTINADQFLHLLRLYESRRKKIIVERFFPWLFSKDFHKWMYDFESISNLLRNCGFQEVERRKFREGKVPDIEILDSKPEQSLYLEAQK